MSSEPAGWSSIAASRSYAGFLLVIMAVWRRPRLRPHGLRKSERTLFCCAHTSVYTLRVKVPGNSHPWYRRREQ
jgi:hypothetical protein